MTFWTIICNINYYDIFGAFDKLKIINWKQPASIETGDIVYIYVTKPFQEIRFKCMVNKTGIPYTDTIIDDSEFDFVEPEDIHDDIYMEIELIEKFKEGMFPYSELKENGLKNIQSPSRIVSALQVYLDEKERTGKISRNHANIEFWRQKYKERRKIIANSKKPVENYDKNIILYGPPGTGKTYYTAIYAVAICDGKSIVELSDYSTVIKRYNELKEERRIVFTTFHQSYGYEEFIEGIRPYIVSGSDGEYTGNIGYRVEPGIFRRFCDIAQRHITDLAADISKTSQNYVFIIDEINRGNISKIFGELITLIEPSKRKDADEAVEAILPYSGKPFSIPGNIYILGTMNTADRSIAIMDTALRRRFKFIEMMPDISVIKDVKIEADGETLDVSKMLDIINKRIELLYDREHMIGHAFFTELISEPSIEKLASVFEKSVIPLLQEYFYEDYEKIQLILGDNGKTGQDKDLKFIMDTEVAPESIFAGNIDDIGLPERQYKFNHDALYNIQSYKKIAPEL